MSLLLFTGFYSCKESEAEKRKKSIEMMTTQTLGLAYLEEFKLDEAEREFQKMIQLAPKEKLGYANLGLVYLRMGKYKEAEEQILKAAEIDPDDADVSLLLSTVYQMDGRSQKAIEVLQSALEKEPGHVKVLYDLATLFSKDTDAASGQLRKNYLDKLVMEAPDNIVPQLQLIDLLIRNGVSDQAIAQLESLSQKFPEFPKESTEYYDKTIEFLQVKDMAQALINFTVFHNYLRVTFPYQSGINELKGPGGSNIGFPLITYNRQVSDMALDDKSVLEVIRFEDVTSEQGLHAIPALSNKVSDRGIRTHLEAADYNGDGNIDLYVGSFDPNSNTDEHDIFDRGPEGFENVTDRMNFEHSGPERGAVFTDFDNDGFLDLYVYTDQRSVLYKNADKGVFENVTESSNIKGGQVNKALFFDMDQDGDLDLFQATENSNRAFRNNGDGSFVEMSNEMGLYSEASVNTLDAAFGDFDDDGDVDLLTVNQNGTILLYTNNRHGNFEVITDIGLAPVKGSRSVSVGDYNNDGFLDVLIGSGEPGQSRLFTNQRDGTFKSETKMNDVFRGLDNLRVNDTEFVDFDNDGFLDVFFTGEPNSDSPGILLYHNDGPGVFSNVSDLLPDDDYSGSQLVPLDYDGDGDLDMLIALKHGGVRLLRNDGGNLNHYVNMKLVGLRTGSAKNNYFGVGVKVELRAGDLYQSMVVTQPNIIFGLGTRKKADIIRITWTNGVPQNILMPDADQALIESQTLKGSCPFLYTWNGTEYEFVKDITWRSALGMPLGIMGGNTQWAFPDASDDYIRIEGEKLEEKDGKYALQITSELWETIYMDQLELIVVDHPDSMEVYVPEQFSPPPFPGLKLYQIDKKYAPVSARDEKGRDLLSALAVKDDIYASYLKPGKFQGLTEMHELVIDPGKAAELDHVHLFLRGWIFPTDASINMALSQSDKLKVVPPVLQVVNENGKWETVKSNMSFPMGKDKTVIVDLSNIFPTSDKRIKVLTNMEIYWDEVFLAEVVDHQSIVSTVLQPGKADLHYRGFSRTFRKGGRYGPHWFDYDSVDKNIKWRDLEGNYTRYGDVLPLLEEADNKYIISNAGDETSVQFNASGLPALKKGWKRDFLIHSVGWVKDGDLNTAYGNKVGPLPYHGMSSYPLSSGDQYPSDKGLEQYRTEYNSRMVSRENFQNAIKPTYSE